MMMNLDPFRELDRMAATLLDRRDTPRVMPIDLYRDADHFVLTAELPGVDPGSVDVDVDGQMLTIRAERTPRSQDGVQWLARERAAGTFQRQLTLGRDIDTESISAHYENGVLSVMIPVAEKAKPRKITIESHDEPKVIETSSS